MKKLLFITSLLCLFLAACSDDDTNGGGSIVIDPGQKDQSVYADIREGSVVFTANDSWTATVQAATRAEVNWLTLGKSSGGAGKVTLDYYLGLNRTGKDRSANILITSEGKTTTVVVTQKAVTKDNEVLSGAKLLKKIVEVTDDGTYTWELKYDDSERLISFKRSSPEENDQSFTYTYGTNSIKGYWENDGYEGSYSVELANGRIIKGMDSYDGGEVLWTATYNGSYVSEIRDYANFPMNATWTNGNLTRVTYDGYVVSANDIEYYTEYALEGNLDINFYIYQHEFVSSLGDDFRLSAMGLYGKNKNLVKSVRNVDTYINGEDTSDYKRNSTYGYKFDDEGYVTRCDIKVTRPEVTDEGTQDVTEESYMIFEYE